MNGHAIINVMTKIDTHAMIFDLGQTPDELNTYVTQILVQEASDYLVQERRDLIEITNTFDNKTETATYTGSIVMMHPKHYKELCDRIDQLQMNNAIRINKF